jgi:hypothetical protein
MRAQPRVLHCEKLQQAERLLHEWARENQEHATQLVLDSVITAELAAMDAINFIKAGL